MTLYLKWSLVTTRPIPNIHQASSVLRRSPLGLLSVTRTIFLEIHYTCSLVIDIQYTRHENAFNKRFERTVCQNKCQDLSRKNSNGGGGGGGYVSDAYYSATYSREVPNALMVLFLFDRVENFVGEENAGYRC